MQHKIRVEYIYIKCEQQENGNTNKQQREKKWLRDIQQIRNLNCTHRVQLTYSLHVFFPSCFFFLFMFTIFSEINFFLYFYFVIFDDFSDVHVFDSHLIGKKNNSDENKKKKKYIKSDRSKYVET